MGARPSDRSVDLLQGTLDLLILRVLETTDLHGWGIADRILVHSKQALTIGEGSLYPALYRLEDRGWVSSSWGTSENNRRAKFYTLTATGKKQLEREEDAWKRLSDAIDGVLRHA